MNYLLHKQRQKEKENEIMETKKRNRRKEKVERRDGRKGEYKDIRY